MSFSTDRAKHNRLGKRAKKERDIVHACVTHMQDKINDTHVKRAEFNRTIANDIAEIKRLQASGASESTLEIMAEAVLHKQNQVELFDGLLLIFSNVRNVLLDLEIQIDAIIGLEWYKYVIRTIPERKLPRMIRSEDNNELSKVAELVESILQKIEDKISRVVVDKNEHEKIMRRIKETSREMRRSYENNSVSSGKSALSKVLGTAASTAPKTMPLPVENTATAEVSNVKYNKA